MRVGLGNLALLKTHLGGVAVKPGDTRWDSVITDIGLGVSDQIENYLDRKLCYAVNDQVVLPADRASFSLPRYPVQIITLAELKLDDADGFVAQPAMFIRSTDAHSGMVYLKGQADAGPYWAQVRFTYTAGYYFPTLDVGDAGYPSVQPAGSVALPNDLKLAWLMQCRRVWSVIDKLGTKMLDNSAAVAAALAAVDFSPETLQQLAHYRRLQLV